MSRGRQAPAPGAPPPEATGPDSAAPPGPAGRPSPASPAAQDEHELKTLGREALARAEQSAAAPPGAPIPARAQTRGSQADKQTEERPFDLARVAWLVTALALLLAVAILVAQGYIGYAAVTLAVAVAAAINLL